MAFSEQLLDILACPQCKGTVRLLDGGSGLVCPSCRLKYPVRDDIPVMLVDEAEKICEK
jgi:uncharacterized protein YbaR (Trm112 family)